MNVRPGARWRPDQCIPTKMDQILWQVRGLETRAVYIDIASPTFGS